MREEVGEGGGYRGEARTQGWLASHGNGRRNPISVGLEIMATVMGREMGELCVASTITADAAVVGGALMTPTRN